MEKTKVIMKNNGSDGYNTCWEASDTGYVDQYVVIRDDPYAIVVLNDSLGKIKQKIVYCGLNEIEPFP